LDRRTGWLKAVNANERGVQIDASTAERPEIEDIQAGIQAGATGFTHVLNAATRDKIAAKDLRMIAHRMIAQFTDRRMYSMVIPNGIHVPEYAVTLMVDGKGPDKVIFVADESPLIGAPVPAKAHLWGRDFEVRLDDAGRVRSYDLSGSCTSLVECMNLATNWGIPRNTVERAVTDNAVAFLKRHSTVSASSSTRRPSTARASSSATGPT